MLSDILDVEVCQELRFMRIFKWWEGLSLNGVQVLTTYKTLDGSPRKLVKISESFLHCTLRPNSYVVLLPSHCRAEPNTSHCFRINTIDWTWLGTAVTRLWHNVWIGSYLALINELKGPHNALYLIRNESVRYVISDICKKLAHLVPPYKTLNWNLHPSLEKLSLAILTNGHWESHGSYSVKQLTWILINKIMWLPRPSQN